MIQYVLDYILLQNKLWGGCISADTSHDKLPILDLQKIQAKKTDLGLVTPKNTEDLLLGEINYDTLNMYSTAIPKEDVKNLHQQIAISII